MPNPAATPSGLLKMIGANFSPLGAALRFDSYEMNKFGYKNMSHRPWREISEIGDEQACL